MAHKKLSINEHYEATLVDVLNSLLLGKNRLEGLILSASERRAIQYFVSGERPTLQNNKLRQILQRGYLTKPEIEDILWLSQGIKCQLALQKEEISLQEVANEYATYHILGVTGIEGKQVKKANTYISNQGEDLLRVINFKEADSIAFVEMCLYVHEAHSALNRHPLALWRAREAKRAIQSIPLNTSYLQELYLYVQFAEIVALRNLGFTHVSQKSNKAGTVEKPLQKIKRLRQELDRSSNFDAIENKSLWRMHLLRDELRTLSQSGRFELGDVLALSREAHTVLEHEAGRIDETTLPVVIYAQLDAEIKALLRSRSSNRAKREVGRLARQIDLESIMDLPMGLYRKLGYYVHLPCSIAEQTIKMQQRML
ncbi:hypothetical protein HC928_06920 [bacterium]|nr:hypothetical protein [bacterium]